MRNIAGCQRLWKRASGAEIRFCAPSAGAQGQPIRGGIEAARTNEWGGKNADGSEGFKEHRPGWDMPIHEILAKNKVAVVFHGHDHMFAKEELEGVVYQLVPQPGNPRSGSPRSARNMDTPTARSWVAQVTCVSKSPGAWRSSIMFCRFPRK